MQPVDRASSRLTSTLMECLFLINIPGPKPHPETAYTLSSST